MCFFVFCAKPYWHQAQDDQSQPKLDPISKRIESLMQLDSISSQAKKKEDTSSKTSRQAMADWIARDLKSFWALHMWPRKRKTEENKRNTKIGPVPLDELTCDFWLRVTWFIFASVRSIVLMSRLFQGGVWSPDELGISYIHFLTIKVSLPCLAPANTKRQ